MMLGLALLLPGSGQGAGAPDATVSLHFERAGLQVPAYTLTVHEDGTGTYVATYVAPAAEGASRRRGAQDATMAPAEVSREMVVTPGMTARIFANARSAGLFAKGCESRARGIANTGAKTLTYEGPEGKGSCVYNYSEAKPVNAVYDTLSGMALTMDEGRALESKHRFDRLGLDAEIGILVDAVHEGRMIEVGNIAPVLQSIAADEQVMERVRKRASGLLDVARQSK